MNNEIREKLHQFIDSLEDKKAAAIYTLFEDEIEKDADMIRLNLIREEREKYLQGEGIAVNWDEVKQMALNKSERNKL